MAKLSTYLSLHQKGLLGRAARTFNSGNLVSTEYLAPAGTKVGEPCLFIEYIYDANGNIISEDKSIETWGSTQETIAESTTNPSPATQSNSIVSTDGNEAGVTSGGRLKVDADLTGGTVNVTATSLDVEDITISGVGTDSGTTSLKVKQQGDVTIDSSTPVSTSVSGNVSIDDSTPLDIAVTGTPAVTVSGTPTVNSTIQNTSLDTKNQTQYSDSVSNTQYWLGLEEDNQLTLQYVDDSVSNQKTIFYALPTVSIDGSCLARRYYLADDEVTGEHTYIGTWTQAMNDRIKPPPTDITVASGSLTTVEDQVAATVLAGFSVAGGELPVTLSMTSNGGLGVEVSGTNLVVATGGIDGSASSSSPFTVGIRATDAFGAIYDENCSVSVTTNVITDITLLALEVFNDAAEGDDIGNLTCTGGVGDVSYAITSNGGLDNLKITDTGSSTGLLEVDTGGIIDVAGTYTVRITATDSIAQTYYEDFTITVLISYENMKALDLNATGVDPDFKSNHVQETSGLFNSHLTASTPFSVSTWLKTNTDPATSPQVAGNEKYYQGNNIDYPGYVNDAGVNTYDKYGSAGPWGDMGTDNSGIPDQLDAWSFSYWVYIPSNGSNSVGCNSDEPFFRYIRNTDHATEGDTHYAFEHELSGSGANIYLYLNYTADLRSAVPAGLRTANAIYLRLLMYPEADYYNIASLDAWTHITVAKTATTAGNSLAATDFTIYINGKDTRAYTYSYVPVLSGSGNWEDRSYLIDNVGNDFSSWGSEVTFLGAKYHSSNTNKLRFTECAFFNKELSDSEVATLYGGTVGDRTDGSYVNVKTAGISGLVGYYKCGDGDSAGDGSGTADSKQLMHDMSGYANGTDFNSLYNNTVPTANTIASFAGSEDIYQALVSGYTTSAPVIFRNGGKTESEYAVLKYLYGHLKDNTNSDSENRAVGVQNVFGSYTNFATDTNWSFSIWFKDTGLDDGGYMLHIGRWSNRGISLLRYSTKISVEMYVGGTDPVTDVTGLTLNDGDWHNITVTYAPDSGNSTVGTNPATCNCLIYVDGVLETATDSVTVTGDMDQINTYLGNQLQLGTRSWGDVTADTSFCHFSSFTKTLSASEVNSILGANDKPKDLAGQSDLECWLPLGDGYDTSNPSTVDTVVGTSAKMWDMSGNSRHGYPHQAVGSGVVSPYEVVDPGAYAVALGWGQGDTPVAGVTALGSSENIYNEDPGVTFGEGITVSISDKYADSTGVYVSTGAQDPKLVISLDGFEDDADKVLVYDNDVTDNTWKNIVVTYDSSATDDKDRISLYVNNVEQTPLGTPSITFTGNNNYFKNVSDTATNTTIGGSGFDAASENSIYALQAEIDSISLHSEALSSTMVTELYDSGVPANLLDESLTSDHTKVETWVSFEDETDSGTTAQDETDNNKDMTLVNMASGDYVTLTALDSIYKGT